MTIATPQHMVALGKATRNRLALAEMRARIAQMPPPEARRTAAAAVLDGTADAMRVGTLLRAIPLFWQVTVRQCCQYAEICRDDLIRDLDSVERERLAYAITLTRPQRARLVAEHRPDRERRLLELLEMERERSNALRLKIRELRWRTP